MISWQTCKNDFEWDGSWRDIYVLKTTIDDWRVICIGLSANYELEFSVDGNVHPFPRTVDEVFVIREQASSLLQFRVGNILVACHFFTADEIEFDIDPREITSQLDLDALLGFLRLVGSTVNKPVVLTPEGGPEYPIITYDPKTGCFNYHDTLT